MESHRGQDFTIDTDSKRVEFTIASLKIARIAAPAMVALGALAGAGRDSVPGRRRPLLVVGVVVVVAAVLVSQSTFRILQRLYLVRLKRVKVVGLSLD